MASARWRAAAYEDKRADELLHPCDAAQLKQLVERRSCFVGTVTSGWSSMLRPLSTTHGHGRSRARYRTPSLSLSNRASTSDYPPACYLVLLGGKAIVIKNTTWVNIETLFDAGCHDSSREYRSNQTVQQNSWQNRQHQASGAAKAMYFCRF